MHNTYLRYSLLTFFVCFFAAGLLWLTSLVPGQVSAVSGLAPTTTVTFAEYSGDASDTTPLLNPERGTYKRKDQEDTSVSDLSSVYTSSSKPSTLPHIYFELRDERADTLGNHQIDPATIAFFNQALANARKVGVTPIIRFRYMPDRATTNSSGTPTTIPPDEYDPAPEVIVKHIEQLASQVINPNKDVIAFVEAGFIGAWGEWHASFDRTGAERFGSSNPGRPTAGPTATQQANRILVRNALYQNIDPSLFILFRYSSDLQDFWYPSALTDAFAFNPVASQNQSRAGHHNDCFVRNESDAGTYPYRRKSNNVYEPDSTYFPYRQPYLDYVAAIGRNVPIGGETCSSAVPALYKCEATDPIRGTLRDFEKLHYTYINDTFHSTVTASWKADSCLVPIQRQLGYRYVVNSAEVPTMVKPGGRFAFNLNITNKGWASIYNKRPVVLVLTNGSNRYELPYPVEMADPRWWKADTTTAVNAIVEIPASIPEGTYDINIWMPDEAPNLQVKQNTSYPSNMRTDFPARFAVRFANNGMWSNSSWSTSAGLNKIGTFQVSNTAPGDSNPQATFRFVGAGEYPGGNPSPVPSPVVTPSPVASPVVTPSPSPFPSPTPVPGGEIKINFGRASTTPDAPFLKDSGEVFADRGNGYQYGWNAANDTGRERNKSYSPSKQHDSLVHMQSSANSPKSWSIALPNGTYQVKVVAGDPSYVDSIYKIAAEGSLLVDGTPTTSGNNYWVTGTRDITVSDGKLDITNHAGADNNKIAFIEIKPAVDHCSAADINEDGVVNAADRVILAENLLKNPFPVARADINKDGVVTMFDYSYLISVFGTSCGD